MSGSTVLFAGMLLFGANDPVDPDVIVSPQRVFGIPFQVDPNREEKISQLILYVSSDKGITWQIVGKARPKDRGFHFRAPKGGLYWFSIQLVHEDKTKWPAEKKDLKPGMKVFVESPSNKPVTLTSPEMPVDEEVIMLRNQVAELERRIALQQGIAELRARVKKLEAELAEIENRSKAKD